MAEKYIVRLTEEERQLLEEITRKGETRAYRILHPKFATEKCKLLSVNSSFVFS